MIDLCFKKLHPLAKLPSYAHEGDAGMDVYAVESITIGPAEQKIVDIGLAVEIPFGYELQVRSRSGLCLKERIVVANGVGTIDHQYRGPIGVVLRNMRLRGTFSVKPGDRVAQLVLASSPRANPKWTQELTGTDRGEGGFGSTGE